MALPTFTWDASFSLDISSTPRVNRTRLGDGYTEPKPVGFRTNLRVWGLNFTALRLDEIQPIIDFLEARNGYRMFKWTDYEPYRRLGIWLAPSWDVTRPNGVSYNLRTVFEEQ